MPCLNFFSPWQMTVGNLVWFIEPVLLDFFQFTLQTSWQNGPAHHFNQTDVFLFNVPELFMRMEDAQWVLLTSIIVSQNQVKHKFIAITVHNWRNGVVSCITVESFQ